ncbi:GNAT family N-acetyltransferase [Saccharicrinis aurantiacus]|uniref:GNAT family N-acetyltransferase n=1 Tax=Saccharicrinis aurantiacus TaxID=1849719 RepID=UPI000838C77C|nr:GNAT family N-acetyltransferase [Saccharicrinis aurantiacus]
MEPILTQRLCIREACDADYPQLLQIYNKQINMRYVSDGKCNWTLDELKQKYHRFNADKSFGIGLWLVVLLDTDEIIGEVGLFNSFDTYKKLELGYIVDEAFWRRGYAYEICEALIHYSFSKLNIESLAARMYADNVASVKLAEKCGMKRVDAGLAPNGKAFLHYELTGLAY